VPYRSTSQRKFMHAVHPDIAAKWDKKYGGKIVKSKSATKKVVKRNAKGR
jgi:hypothetical protein